MARRHYSHAYLSPFQTRVIPQAAPTQRAPTTIYLAIRGRDDKQPERFYAMVEGSTYDAKTADELFGLLFRSQRINPSQKYDLKPGRVKAGGSGKEIQGTRPAPEQLIYEGKQTSIYDLGGIFNKRMGDLLLQREADSRGMSLEELARFKRGEVLTAAREAARFDDTTFTRTPEPRRNILLEDTPRFTRRAIQEAPSPRVVPVQNETDKWNDIFTEATSE